MLWISKRLVLYRRIESIDLQRWTEGRYFWLHVRLVSNKKPAQDHVPTAELGTTHGGLASNIAEISKFPTA